MGSICLPNPVFEVSYKLTFYDSYAQMGGFETTPLRYKKSAVGTAFLTCPHRSPLNIQTGS